MKKEFLDLPTWEFEIHEESMGVYEMTGKSVLGHRVSAKGIDPDALIERCRKEAERINASVKNKQL